MSAQVFAFLRRPARQRDWLTQELAEFYRVEAALMQAGLQVISERGLTDEGDPWFVFCRADDDEVIIHFARIGGRYLISAPAYCGTATGHDFRALVRGTLDRHPVLQQRPRDDNLFFHPAALLVVLVTSAFLKTGHAAEAAPAKPAADATGVAQRHVGSAVASVVAADVGHEALILLVVATALAVPSPAKAELGTIVVSASAHLPEFVDQAPAHPTSHGMMTLPLTSLVDGSVTESADGSGSVTPPSSVPLPWIATPMAEVSLSPAVQIVPQGESLSWQAGSSAVGPVAQTEPVQMIPLASETHLSALDPASGAQLVSLSALSGISKADLDLLHSLSVPEIVPYVATLPAAFAAELKDGAHSSISHSTVTQPSSDKSMTSPPAAEPAIAHTTAEPTPPHSTAESATSPAAAKPEIIPPGADPATAQGPAGTAHALSVATGSANPPGVSGAATPTSSPDMSAVLVAVGQFQTTAIHSVLVVTAHAAIFYDAAATTANYGAVTSVTYDFGDGFSVSLVGLPSELPHASVHV